MCSAGWSRLREIAFLQRSLRITSRCALHLHFEVWRGGPADRFDPASAMAAWEYLPDPGDLPQLLAARNARAVHGPPGFVRVRQHTRSYPRR